MNKTAQAELIEDVSPNGHSKAMNKVYEIADKILTSTPGLQKGFRS